MRGMNYDLDRVRITPQTVTKSKFGKNRITLDKIYHDKTRVLHSPRSIKAMIDSKKQ